MKKNLIRIAAMGFGLAAVFAVPSLNAASIVSERMTIPFDFRVAKTSLPSGIYRVERDFGKPVVTLVNVKTGQRVQVLRNDNERVPGRTKLLFESTGQGYSLKRLS